MSATPASSDRNLLYGILALQRGFLREAELIATLHAWALLPHKCLGELLLERHAISPAQHAEVRALVEARLGQAGDDDSSRHTDSVGGPYLVPSRYLPERLHRKGGLGEVYVAREHELDRTVALKQLQEGWADDRISRARFVLEARVTSKLEHPGIVPIYGMGAYPDGRPYYAMRFIEGETLREALKRFHKSDEAPSRDPSERAVTFRELLGRFVTVCQAVAYAHSRGVLHRDLKPSNVMLGPYGETVVIDWGLAQADDIMSGPMTPLTVPGRPIGTPQYMAPEQAAGRPDEISPRTDVYLLGAILYELLTGEPPFPDMKRGPHPPAAIARKPGAPAALSAIAQQAMDINPARRQAGAAELAGQVQRWLADEPLAAYREAIAQLEQQARLAPKDPALREALARNRNNLGLVLAGMGRHAQAETAFRAAVSEYGLLVAAHPARAGYRAEMATTRLNLRQALLVLGRGDEAKRQEDEAVRAYDQLIAESPGDYRSNLASVMITLAPEARQTAASTAGQGGTWPPAAVPPSRRVLLTEAPPTGNGPRTEEQAAAYAPSQGLTELHFLARGGMATIYAARENMLGRRVAIKTLIWPHAEAVERLWREAQITSQLQHPGIIPVYGVGTRAGDEQPFLMLRYLPGRSLDQLIHDCHALPGPINYSGPAMGQMLRAFAQACRALAYAHRRGVVHRDPKPANIVLDESGDAVVIDWGLARVIGDGTGAEPAIELSGPASLADTMAGAVVGTPAFMAPEMARGEHHLIGPRTDVWVLGATLFNVLTGRPPFEGSSASEVLGRVVEGAPPRPRDLAPEVPRALDAICARALSAKRGWRQAGANELAEEVERWLAGRE